MKKAILCLIALVLAASVVPSADPPLADGVSGAPVAWSEWLPKKAPVAILVWASWAPDAERVMDSYQEIAGACTDAGLHLVVLDVQETLEDGRKALGKRQVTWIHDRHGALLKTYRVIEVPSLLVISSEGEVSAKIDATPEAVREWRGR